MCKRCGCCETAVNPTPETVTNQPGLAAIAYRVGTYNSFRQAMLQAIAGAAVEIEGETLKPLPEWTARTADDYGITLLEMWAYLGDILTFYQERIANEAYLPTAVHRESVLRLAALLDYEPSPGVAAGTYMAFTVEKDKTVVLEPGLRIQSVPESKDDKPQKFETIETVTAVSRLNRFRVYPLPQAYAPLAQGRKSGTALGDINHLAPGDQIVIYKPVNQAGTGARAAGKKMIVAQIAGGATGAAVIGEEVILASGGVQAQAAGKGAIIGQIKEAAAIGTTAEQGQLRLLDCLTRPIAVEDKEITGIEEIDWRQVISWQPAVRCDFANDALIHKWRRKFRLFGHNAPATFFTVNVDSRNNVTWKRTHYDYTLTNTNVLPLDTTVDDLKENTSLLIVARLGGRGDGALVKQVTIEAVAQVSRTVSGGASGDAPAMQATVTELTLKETLPAGVDVRTAVIYELEGEAISLWPKRYPTGLSGNKLYIPQVEMKSADLLEKGRRLIVIDDNDNLLATPIAAVALAGDHIEVTLDDALAGLDAATAVAYGNVLAATHGETITETLGNGDAASRFLSFDLKKSPVTFVADETAVNGAANTLAVRVDGVLWQEVGTFYGQDGEARVFTTRVDDEAQMTVTFGNGQTGAPPPTGNNNITAVYRQGIGQGGNVAKSTLTNLLDKPLGLKEAVNPAAASGGAAPDSLADAREKAPHSVRTFDRIVSLTDFADAARSFAGVAKARAVWEWIAGEQRVLLTVAGDDGATIEPGSDTHARLVAFLNQRRDPHRPLLVTGYRPVPVVVEAAIQVNADYLAEEVVTAVTDTLSRYFDFDSLHLGQPIHLSDIYRVIQNVAGVIYADIDRLQYKRALDRGRHGVDEKPVQAHLPIFAQELATVAAAAADLRVQAR